jgi:hypothetical protein
MPSSTAARVALRERSLMRAIGARPWTLTAAVILLTPTGTGRPRGRPGEVVSLQKVFIGG